MIPTDAGDPHDGADALFAGYRLHARLWLVQVVAEVRNQCPGLLPALADEDWEDLRQEAEVALWTAARRYARHEAKAGSGRCPHRSFREFAQVHVRGELKAYVTGWWSDPDFQLLPDLADRPYASVFCLWPEV